MFLGSRFLLPSYGGEPLFTLLSLPSTFIHIKRHVLNKIAIKTIKTNVTFISAKKLNGQGREEVKLVIF